MRKILFATTALVAVSYGVSGAIAQESQMMSAQGNEINLSGYYTFGWVKRDDDGGDDSQTYGDSELHIDFMRTGDSGLTYGVQVDIEIVNGESHAESHARDGGASNSDEASIFVSSGFGTLHFGHADGAYGRFQTLPPSHDGTVYEYNIKQRNATKKIVSDFISEVKAFESEVEELIRRIEDLISGRNDSALDEESLSSDIDAIDLDMRVEKINMRVKELNQRSDILTSDLKFIQLRVDALNSDIDTLEMRIRDWIARTALIQPFIDGSQEKGAESQRFSTLSQEGTDDPPPITDDSLERILVQDENISGPRFLNVPRGAMPDGTLTPAQEVVNAFSTAQNLINAGGAGDTPANRAIVARAERNLRALGLHDVASAEAASTPTNAVMAGTLDDGNRLDLARSAAGRGAAYNDDAKITYVSPIINGFQFGASWEDDSGNDANPYSVGAKYGMWLGDAIVTLEGGYYNNDRDGANESIDTQYGVTLDVGRFKATAAYYEGDRGASETLETVELGVGYQFNNRLTVGASWAEAENDWRAREGTFTSVAAWYKIANGLRTKLAWSNYDVNTTLSGTLGDANNTSVVNRSNKGDEIVAEIEVTF